MSYFIITHKEIPWEIPFNHFTVGVEGFHQSEKSSISAAGYISKLLDQETALGTLRALPAINCQINTQMDNDDVFITSYRLFLSQDISSNWLSNDLSENLIMSPDQLIKNWELNVMTQIPNGVDIVLPAAKNINTSLMNQYCMSHHLDDLMFGVGVAIRAGLLMAESVPNLLQAATLIPYGNFASNKKIRVDFNDRLWWCALEFYKKHYIPRIEYQRRVIDFVFERISSMAIIQKIIKEGLHAICSRSILISNDGNYVKTK